MGDLVERLVIEEASIALVREYLNRKKCKSSLEALEAEMPRSPQSICNRAELAQSLHIAPLIRKNKTMDMPFNTVIEMLVWDLLRRHQSGAKEGRSRSPKRPITPNIAKAKLRTAPEKEPPRIENLEIEDVEVYPRKESLEPSKFYKTMSPPTSPTNDIMGSPLTERKGTMSTFTTPVTRPKSDKAGPEMKSGRPSRQHNAPMMGQGLRTAKNQKGQKPKKASSVLEMLSASPEKVMSARELPVENKGRSRVKTPDRETRSPKDKKMIRPKTATSAATKPGVGSEAMQNGTEKPKHVTILEDIEDENDGVDLGEVKCTSWLRRSTKPNFEFDPLNPGMGMDVPEAVQFTPESNDKTWQSVKTKMSQRQPKRTSFEMSIGVPLEYEVAVRLRQLVFGSSSIRGFKEDWSNQSFVFRQCKDERTNRLRFGLIQKKGGPCGVLAALQGFVLKHLLFGKVGNMGSEVMMATPSQLNVPSDVRTSCLAEAIIEILWRAGGQKKGVLATLSTKQSFEPVGTYVSDGITEYVITNECLSLESLHKVVYNNIKQFEQGRGAAVLLLYSAILSRGTRETLSDMDDPGNTLMGAHSYCTQEMVNLLTVGVAASNVFDGHMNLDDGAMLLRGVCNRGELGHLSLFEHYDSCKVGDNLKTPKYPIWIVHSESHFSVLFCLERDLIDNRTAGQPFDLYYYDGLARQDEEVKLTVRTTGRPHPPQHPDGMVPPLEQCIRTKWPRAFIDWNGTEPIL